MSRSLAERLDREDPLAPYRDEFVIADQDLIYLDGNSLGRLPKRTVGAVAEVVESRWGSGLVRSWPDWIELPVTIGDLLAPLVGAAPGETLLSDQTSVNLYKLACAALDATGRRDIVTSNANFPSDLYVLASVADRRGGTLRVLDVDPLVGPVPAQLSALLDEEVGLVSFSHVGFRTGTIVDMAGLSAAARAAGALTLWDLSHSVGAVPVDLTGTGADLAVGCTYKYLNGGPGAPAFLWVRTALQDRLAQPIHGWFGHADKFAFHPAYRPAPGIGRFAVGTPPILSLTAARCGIELSVEAGIDAIRVKSTVLTNLIIDRFDDVLVPLGFSLFSPRDDSQRGGHVAIRHPDAYRVTRALIDRGVVPDFRDPDVIRLGVAALSTTFTEVWDAIDIVADVVRSGAHLSYGAARDPVT